MRLTPARNSNAIIMSAARSSSPSRDSQAVIPSAPRIPSRQRSAQTVISREARNPGLIVALLSRVKPWQTAPRVFSALFLLLLSASSARAEYVVLQSGLRLHVTGYQLLGEKYRLQLQGGWMDVQTADVVKIEPEEVFTPIPQPPAAVAPPGPTAGQSPFGELVAAAASRYGVDAELITSVMEVESHFDPKAISPKNARGLMQLLPETAARLGVKDIFDPQQNIDAGTRYLKELLQLYNNDLTLTLAAYNAGPDKVQKYGDVPPFRETVSYVKQVKRKYQKSKSALPAKTPDQAASPKAPASPAPSAGSSAPNPPPPGSGTQPGAPATPPSTPPKIQNQ